MRSRMHESAGERAHHMMEHLTEMERGHTSSHGGDGMARHPKRGNLGGLGEEYYAGYDPRRALEKRDGDMIFEDHRAIANLPPAAFMREWPKPGYEHGRIRPDDVYGIDMQIDNDELDISSNHRHNKA